MSDVAARRLSNQLISRTGLRRAEDVVAWLGAVQAQEYGPAKWALGLRMTDGASDAAIERAFADGRILRTHVMRPTWHFVTPSDIRWLLELTGARVKQRIARYDLQLGLDARTITRGIGIIERTLAGGRYQTRTELAGALQRAKLPLSGPRLGNLAMHAEAEGVICSGPRVGAKSTYALIAERAPHAPSLPRDEALDALGRRFFRSHGPATIRDFVWWSGLTTADAKRAVEMIRARRETIGHHEYWSVGRAAVATRPQVAHLLPIYDEYLVAYRDRDHVPHRPSLVRPGPRVPVVFQHSLIVDRWPARGVSNGRRAGRWSAPLRCAG